MTWEMINRREPIVGPKEAAVLSEELRERIEAMARQFPVRQGALLPALLAVQHEHRHVSAKAIEELAEVLGLPTSLVLDTMSFYTHLSTTPRGRHLVMVCRGLSCELCGQADLLAALKSRLGVDEGGTTADGRFTLVTEECIGACEKAPCLLVDDRLYGPVGADGIDAILDEYA